jgi:hypothetical protein
MRTVVLPSFPDTVVDDEDGAFLVTSSHRSERLLAETTDQYFTTW